MAPNLSGKQLGDYRLARFVGAGGMGQVYQGEHRFLKVVHAIKVLTPEMARRPGLTERFLAEGQAMARLRHPHIVQVHALGSHADTFYLAMDWIAGASGNPQSLEDIAARATGGRLPEDAVIRFMGQVCSALSAAHAAGIIHRDLKPANILVDASDKAYLMDFGLVKMPAGLSPSSTAVSAMPTLADDVAEKLGQTLVAGDGIAATLAESDHSPSPSPHSGQNALGTWVWMAPEQQRGEVVDSRADIYSLGVILARLLSGRVPEGFSDGFVTGVPGVNPKWESIIARSMAEDPSDRYATAEALMDAIAGISPKVVPGVERTPPAQAPVPPRSTARFASPVGTEMVRIAPGEFLMGSPESEPGRKNNERQHSVKLTREFWIAVHPVRVADYAQFVRETNHSAGDGWQHPGYPQEDDHPVVGVNWHDAKAFCRWISDKDNRTYSLPTEAQWEFACRAGQPGIYGRGDREEDLAAIAWYLANAQGRTHGVGGRDPNPHGVYDMLGNVWEWCLDGFGPHGGQPETDPRGLAASITRVLKGGAFNIQAVDCRCAKRTLGRRESRGPTVGFRVVAIPEA